VLLRGFWIQRVFEAWEDVPIVWVIGLPGVGKTSIGLALASCLSKGESLFVDCVKDSARELISRPKSLWNAARDRKLLVVDNLDSSEAVPDLILKLVGKIPKLKVLMLGGALPPLGKMLPQLASNVRFVQLGPFLMHEAYELTGSRSIMLDQGCLPGALLWPGRLEDFRDPWIQNFARRVISARQGRFNVDKVLHVLSYCLQRSGEVFRAAKAARDLGIARPTVESAVDFLAKTQVLTLVYPLTSGYRKESGKLPKIYAFDSAFHLNSNPSFPAVESLALAQLKAIFPSCRICFWRTKAERDVAFVLVQENGDVDTVTVFDPDIFGEAQNDSFSFPARPAVVLRNLRAFRRSYPQGKNLIFEPVGARKFRVGKIVLHSVKPTDLGYWWQFGVRRFRRNERSFLPADIHGKVLDIVGYYLRCPVRALVLLNGNSKWKPPDLIQILGENCLVTPKDVHYANLVLKALGKRRFRDLWERFPPDLVPLLREGARDYRSHNRTEVACAVALNYIIEGESIFRPERFKGVEFSELTQQLLNQYRSDYPKALLNRLLLDDAMLHFVRVPESGVSLRGYEGLLERLGPHSPSEGEYEAFYSVLRTLGGFAGKDSSDDPVNDFKRFLEWCTLLTRTLGMREDRILLDYPAAVSCAPPDAGKFSFQVIMADSMVARSPIVKLWFLDHPEWHQTVLDGDSQWLKSLGGLFLEIREASWSHASFEVAVNLGMELADLKSAHQRFLVTDARESDFLSHMLSLSEGVSEDALPPIQGRRGPNRETQIIPTLQEQESRRRALKQWSKKHPQIEAALNKLFGRPSAGDK
jgi:predicted AAA+ superfamily ATPase